MEHILAFGLGIMLVTTIVLVYVVLKSNKKVNELSQLEKVLNDYHRYSADEDKEIYREIDKINSKIDSRVDKLHDVMMREIEHLNKKADFLRRSLGKEY